MSGKAPIRSVTAYESFNKRDASFSAKENRIATSALLRQALLAMTSTRRTATRSRSTSLRGACVCRRRGNLVPSNVQFNGCAIAKAPLRHPHVVGTASPPRRRDDARLSIPSSGTPSSASTYASPPQWGSAPSGAMGHSMRDEWHERNARGAPPALRATSPLRQGGKKSRRNIRFRPTKNRPCGRSFGRGRRIRTLNKGFGDPRVTITPCPYVLANVCYYTLRIWDCQ